MPAAAAPKQQPRPRRHLLAVGVPLLLVLVVAALFAARLWLNAFLHSDGFRHFLESKSSAQLDADVQLEPLHWEGSEVYSDAVNVQGNRRPDGLGFVAEQVRANLNFGALWHGVWQIDAIEVAKVLAKATPRSASIFSSYPQSLKAEEAGAPPENSLLARWLPTRVEIGKIHVSNFSLDWTGIQSANEGRLDEVELTARPRDDDHSWEITGRHGRLLQARLPNLQIEEFRLKANTHQLVITQATTQATGGGQVDFTGSQDFEGDRNLSLDANFDGLPSESFLPADWRARLHGLGSGTVHITGSASSTRKWHANGHVDLHDGRLEALPVLDELAVFTLTARFRQANLQRGSADFDWNAGVLTVSHLELESEGLIRLEGGFTVRNEQIAGQLEVGVARSAGRLLAGVGARVFNQPERDGYLWTTVQLSGSSHDPHEDLTARLVQATQDEVVQKAKQGADTMVDTATGLLNLLQPPH
jgi:hypothetical protein